MILADKIIQQRKRNGWSQEELAEKLGVTRQSVSKWEGAQAVPDLQRILEMSRIFGVSTDYLLKDEVEESDDACYAAEEAEPVRRVSMEEANSFLEVKRRTAPRTAFGVFLCILSPVCLLMLGAFSVAGKLRISDNAAGGIGLVILLLLVAAAVTIFMFCGKRTRAYEYLETEAIETEYGVSSMVREKQKQYEGRYTVSNICGTILCILGVLPIFIGSAVTEDEVAMTAMVCLLLVIEGIGVMIFVNAGTIWGSFQMLLCEGDYSAEEKRRSKKNHGIAAVYWLTATAIFLGYSFITNDWQRSWIVFAVAGVLFPAVITVRNMMS